MPTYQPGPYGALQVWDPASSGWDPNQRPGLMDYEWDGSQTTPAEQAGVTPTSGSNERSSEAGAGYSRDAGYTPDMENYVGSDQVATGPFFSDDFLATLAALGRNRFLTTAAGMAVPFSGSALWAGGKAAQWALDRRNDAWSDFSDYGVGIMNQPTPYNPGMLDNDTADRPPLGQPGGMPGSHTREGDFAGDRNVGRAAFGSGGPWYQRSDGSYAFSMSGHPDGGDLVVLPDGAPRG